jgi:hypothetical protein
MGSQGCHPERGERSPQLLLYQRPTQKCRDASRRSAGQISSRLLVHSVAGGEGTGQNGKAGEQVTGRGHACVVYTSQVNKRYYTLEYFRTMEPLLTCPSLSSKILSR